MSSPNLDSSSPEEVAARLQERTLEACQLARKAAGIVAEGIATGVASLLDGVREREKELDALDREIDQGVTAIITKVDEQTARELLACVGHAGCALPFEIPSGGMIPAATLAAGRSRNIVVNA